jgi:hypothetical protein
MSLPTTDLPALDLSKLSAVTRAAIDARFDADGDASAAALDALGGLQSVLFELVNLALRSGGPIGQGMAELLRAALRESGYSPAGPCADADILRMLELTGSSLPRDEAQADAHARQILMGAAVALAAGDPYAAQTFLDGPEGAGIGWDLTRQEVQLRHNASLPPIPQPDY